VRKGFVQNVATKRSKTEVKNELKAHTIRNCVELVFLVNKLTSASAGSSAQQASGLILPLHISIGTILP
jgi:hypothetical protein